jgi:hypothetical protein
MWLYRRIVIHGESFIALLVGLRYMYFCMSKGVWAHDGFILFHLLLEDDWWRVSYHVNDTYGRVILLRVSIIKHNDSVRVLLHPVLSICRDYYYTMIQLCAVNAFKLNIRLHHSFSLLLHDERKKGAWNSKCHEEHSSKMDPYWKVDPTTIFCSPNTCGIIAVWCASGSNGCVHEFSQYFSSNDGTIIPSCLDDSNE